jgi:hypothetical protein
VPEPSAEVFQDVKENPAFSKPDAPGSVILDPTAPLSGASELLAPLLLKFRSINDTEDQLAYRVIDDVGTYEEPAIPARVPPEGSVYHPLKVLPANVGDGSVRAGSPTT